MRVLVSTLMWSLQLYLQVLTHGYLVTHHNVSEFVKYISVELNKFENGVAAYMNSILRENAAVASASPRVCFQRS